MSTTARHCGQLRLCVLASVGCSAAPQLGQASARPRSVFSLSSRSPVNASSSSTTLRPIDQPGRAGSTNSSVPTSPCALRRSTTVKSRASGGGAGSSPCADTSRACTTEATLQGWPSMSARWPGRSASSAGAVCSAVSKATT